MNRIDKLDTRIIQLLVIGTILLIVGAFTFTILPNVSAILLIYVPWLIGIGVLCILLLTIKSIIKTFKI